MIEASQSAVAAWGVTFMVDAATSAASAATPSPAEIRSPPGANSGGDDRAVQQPEHTQQGSSYTDPSHRVPWSLQQIKAVEIFHRMRNSRELGPPDEG